MYNSSVLAGLASAVVAIVSTVGGGIWYASSQASIIEGLTEQVETLTIENNATDRTNLIRDVEENTERIDEIIEYIIEVEEEGSLAGDADHAGDIGGDHTTRTRSYG